MSENTTTAEIAAPEDQEQDQEFPILLDGVPFTRLEIIGKVGKAKGRLYHRLKFPLDNPATFQNFIKFVGFENFWTTVIKKVINVVCDDAAQEALDEESGMVDPDKWPVKIKEGFEARRGGNKIAQLREKLEEKTKEIAEMMHIARELMKPNNNVSEEDMNAYFRAIAEWTELQEKIEHKKPKARKPKTA